MNLKDNLNSSKMLPHNVQMEINPTSEKYNGVLPVRVKVIPESWTVGDTYNVSILCLSKELSRGQSICFNAEDASRGTCFILAKVCRLEEHSTNIYKVDIISIAFTKGERGTDVVSIQLADITKEEAWTPGEQYDVYVPRNNLQAELVVNQAVCFTAISTDKQPYFIFANIRSVLIGSVDNYHYHIVVTSKTYIKGDKGDIGEKGDTGKGIVAITVVDPVESEWSAGSVKNINTSDKVNLLKIRDIITFTSFDTLTNKSCLVLGEITHVFAEWETYQYTISIKGVQLGVVGPRGIQGPQGERGEIGPQGIQGLQGPQGEKGEKGNQGIQGEKGDQGIQGPKGTTWYPTVTPKGNITWSSNDTIVTPIGTNIMGPQGPKGERGPQGPIGPAGAGGSLSKKTIYDLSKIDDLKTEGIYCWKGLNYSTPGIGVPVNWTYIKSREPSQVGKVSTTGPGYVKVIVTEYLTTQEVFVLKQKMPTDALPFITQYHFIRSTDTQNPRAWTPWYLTI